MSARIFQLNLKPRTAGERGIPKTRVDEAIVTAQGLATDFNRYRHEKKGDAPDKALLLIPVETIGELNDEGWPVEPGHLGENVTTQGIVYQGFAVGKKFRLGEVEIQITQQATPCANLHLLPYASNERGPRFLQTLLDRRGWFARILKEGTLKSGDPLEVLLD